MMKKLYFMRHGESEMNVAGLFSGHTDTPLTKNGKAQAKKAGQAAKGLGIDLIVCSPLSRAHETAKIFAKQIGYPAKKIVTSPVLIERFYGAMEGKPYAPDLNMDGVADFETKAVLLERAREAVDWLESLQADSILVVSHGAIGRAIRYHLVHDADFHERIPNAELVCWIEG